MIILKHNPALAADRSSLFQKKGASWRSPFNWFNLFNERSEEELDRHFNDAMALLVSGDAEIRVVGLECVGIKAEAEVSSIEGPQRMVQEIVSGEPELQGFGLTDFETLVESEIPVEIPWSIDGRDDDPAILADPGGNRETIGVDVLVLTEVGFGIARQDRIELYVGRSQQRDVADVEVGSGYFGAVEIHPEVLPLVP